MMKKIITIILLAGTTIFYAQEKDTIEQYEFSDVKINKEIKPLKYDNVSNFKNGVAVVKIRKKYGIINSEGKEISAIKYDEVNNYKNGLIEVRLGKKYGVLNSLGKEIIPIKYDLIDIYKNMFVLGNKYKYKAFDLNGIEISPISYDYIESVGMNSDSIPIYEVKLKGKYGLVNEKFEKVTDIKYDYISRIAGAIEVEINGKYGFLNLQGEDITEIKYEAFAYSIDIGKKSITPALLDNKWIFLMIRVKRLHQFNMMLIKKILPLI